MLANSLDYLRRNAIGLSALGCALLALGGASYAAVSLPAGSVGSKQLKTRGPNAIGGYVLAWAHVRSNGMVLSGSPGAVAAHSAFSDGTTPAGINYNVGWRGARITSRCAPIVTIDSNGPVSSRGAWAEANIFPKYTFVGSRKTHGHVEVIVASPGNSDVPDNFFVAVVC